MHYGFDAADKRKRGGGGRTSGGGYVSPTTVPVLPFFFSDAENLLAIESKC